MQLQHQALITLTECNVRPSCKFMWNIDFLRNRFLSFCYVLLAHSNDWKRPYWLSCLFQATMGASERFGLALLVMMVVMLPTMDTKKSKEKPEWAKKNLADYR